MGQQLISSTLPRIARALEEIAEALTKNQDTSTPEVEVDGVPTKGDILRAFARDNGIELVDFKLSKEQS